MKKIAMYVAFLSLVIAVNAQTVNVQSAMTDLKRGYLDKAKIAIDKACEHPDTKDDAKTWYYAGLIYTQIGDAATNPQSQYKKWKNLDPDWCDKAYNAALRCKKLDTKNEYANGNNNIFGYLGNEYYRRSIDEFNAGNYAEARKLSDDAIKMFNNSGNTEYANESYYIAGYACQMLNDNEGVKKYYGPLVRKPKVKEDFASKMPAIYRTMFHVYKDANDTVNVMKLANNYTKALPNDPNAQLLLADAYIWTGNPSKGISLAQKAIEMTKGTDAQPLVLCAAASVYEAAGDYDGAESLYKESAQLQPNQLTTNLGMGLMFYNRGVDKIKALNNPDLYTDDDNMALINKLTEEYKDLLSQAIPYLQNAIAYLDGLDEEHRAQNRSSLYNSLKALSNCYVRLDKYNEAKPIQDRILLMEKSN